MSLEKELAFKPAYEVKEQIVNKEISPVELTQLFFDRIDELDGQLNSYITLDYENAMHSARSAEEIVMKGGPFGPLHGIPVSIKDMELTKNLRSTAGSILFKDRVPTEDSVVSERVRAAGAIILGKTNTPEFGHKGTTENLLGDACRNPWNTSYTTGGSSGGAAAALISGLCALATGTDGGGSIRIPASYCGVYGIKPTQGRVPRYMGAGSSVIANQLAISGPLSRTVRDSALLLQVLSGHDGRDPASIRDVPPDFVSALDMDVSGLRIGWSADFGFAPVDPEVAEVCYEAAKAFEEIGCTVADSNLNLESPERSFKVLFSTNTYAAMSSVIESDRDKFTDYFLHNMDFARELTGADYAFAVGYVDYLRAKFDQLFESFDLLISPTMAVPPFPIGDYPEKIAGQNVDPFAGIIPFTYPINMIGNPAASVPAGFSHTGLPIGLHLIGRYGDERLVLAASAAFERLRPWAQLMPPVS